MLVLFNFLYVCDQDNRQIDRKHKTRYIKITRAEIYAYAANYLIMWH